MVFEYTCEKDCNKDDQYLTKTYCESFCNSEGCTKIGHCEIYKRLKK